MTKGIITVVLVILGLQGYASDATFRAAMAKVYQKYSGTGDFMLVTRMHLYPSHSSQEPFESEVSRLKRKGNIRYQAIDGKIETYFDGSQQLYINHLQKVLILQEPQINSKALAGDFSRIALSWLDTLSQLKVYTLQDKAMLGAFREFTLSFDKGQFKTIRITMNPETGELRRVNVYYRHPLKIARDLPATPIHLEIVYEESVWEGVSAIPAISSILQPSGQGYVLQQQYAGYKFIDKSKALKQKR